MPSFNGTESISRHCGRTKAREDAHRSPARHMVPKQWIFIQLGDGTTGYASSSFGMLGDLAERPADDVRFLSKSPKLLLPQKSRPARHGATRVVHARENRIRPVHNRIRVGANAVGYPRNEIAKRDRPLRDAARVEIPSGVRRPLNRV